MAPPSSTRILLTARRRAWRNRWRAQSPARRRGALLGAVGVIAAVLTLGHFAAPSLMVPPIETTTPGGFEPRSSHVAGASALESCFWLVGLIAAIFSFRVMELLFRRRDIRSVDQIPLTMRAYFVDRLVYGIGESLAWGGGVALFFAPLAWHGGALAALACALMALLGPLVVLLTGMGVQLFFGASEFGRPRGDNGERAAVDSYGGAGQSFIFAPGAALGIAAVLLLLLKLALGELVRLEGFNRATMLGVGIGAGAARPAGAVARLRLGRVLPFRTYPRMHAGFRDGRLLDLLCPARLPDQGPSTPAPR